jgi:hypothetical protein
MWDATRRQFVGSAALPLLAAAPPSVPEKRLLSAAWPPDKLNSVLLPRERWKPFPAAADRAAWQSLDADTARSLLETGEQRLASGWDALPATVFLQYARTGNRSNYERIRNVRRDKLRELVLAECVENNGRFSDAIVDGVWLTCEETYWGLPAHLNMQKAGSGLPDAAEPTVDLFAAETSSLLAWTDYLLAPQLDKVSPLVRKRIRMEIDRRVLAPNYERSDFSWMGLDPGLTRPVNNWNPWINSNWLTSVLLMESDPQRRVAAVHKILRSLDRFLDGYHEDGGCDEGPSYWFRAGGSLFDCLELLHSASGGKVDFYSLPLVREIGRYIYRAHISGEYFTNFADASAKLRIAGDLVYRYGRRIGDEKMQAFGAWAFAQQKRPGADSIGRQLPALFNLSDIRKAGGHPPLLRDVWLPGVQVMAARLKEGSDDGLYLATQGGHNAESHNHNDVGNFIVYADGQPAIIDVGVETYTAKTFSSRRYEIWTMQSAYHNLPTVNGVMQGAGREFESAGVAYRAGGDSAEFDLGIARAYPPEAGITEWRRTLLLDRRRNQVEVTDRYALRIQPGRIEMTLMTPCRIVQSVPGELRLNADGFRTGPVVVRYDATLLSPKVEEIRIEDARLKPIWGDRVFRILLVAEKALAQGTITTRISQS